MLKLLMAKKERDILYARLKLLSDEREVAMDNARYYAEKLGETRKEIIEIFNLVGAKTEVADVETVDLAWSRYIKAIKDRLKCN